MDTTNELKTYWEKYEGDYVTKYRCPLCHTDAAYQIVDEDGRLRYRLENFCPHCGKRLYNPNLSTEK